MLLFVINIVLVVFSFVAYLLPFLPPSQFSFLSVFSLGMPFFFVSNALFVVYWLFKFRKRIVFSMVVLLLGITFINKFYKFSQSKYTFVENDFKVMSYNVRLFNLFEWIDYTDVPKNILNFVNEQNPDILCVQEFSNSAKVDFKIYPYKHIFFDGDLIRTGQAVFSKFPILNQGEIVFQNSGNNVVFADIKKGKDVIRIYSMHLQSLKISPDISQLSNDIESINEQKSKMIFGMAAQAFKLQQEQAEQLKNHIKTCDIPVILCGDMNNSAFSYIYRKLKGDMNDCFEENGLGFGNTYNFKYYPARIDYIFADKSIEVKNFETFNRFNNSDHFPIMATLHL